MVQHRLKTHYGVPPKRRKPTQKMPSTTTTTTYQLTTKDGEMIDDQVRSLKQQKLRIYDFQFYHNNQTKHFHFS
jgi:hypothetical protein